MAAKKYRLEAISYRTVNGQNVGTSAPIVRTYRTEQDALDGVAMYRAVAVALDAVIVKDAPWYVLTQRKGEWNEIRLLPV